MWARRTTGLTFSTCWCQESSRKRKSLLLKKDFHSKVEVQTFSFKSSSTQNKSCSVSLAAHVTNSGKRHISSCPTAARWHEPPPFRSLPLSSLSQKGSSIWEKQPAAKGQRWSQHPGSHQESPTPHLLPSPPQVANKLLYLPLQPTTCSLSNGLAPDQDNVITTAHSVRLHLNLSHNKLVVCITPWFGCVALYIITFQTLYR